MLKLSFPTRKLKGSLIKITDKYKNFENKTLQAYGVTNKEGIVITGKNISDDTSNYTVITGKTFVYNPYRINVGSIGLTDDDFKGIVSPAYVAFKVKDDILPEFLLLYLKSSLGINLIKWYGDRGGVRSALRFNDLEKIDFPDLSYEQQEEALKNINKFIKIQNTLNQEMGNQITYISKFRQSILQDAIQGKLVLQDPTDEPASELLKKIKEEKKQLIKEGKIKKDNICIESLEEDFLIPSNWQWTYLKDICWVITDGTHKTPTYFSQGVPFLSVKNVRPYKINDNEKKFISLEEHHLISKRCKPEKNDILYTKVGATYGYAAINKLDYEFSIFVSVALIKPIRKYFTSEYAELVLNSPYVYKQASKKISGIAVPDLHLVEIRSFKIPLPPVEEQKRIVARVKELMQLCDKLENENNNMQKYSSVLLQSIMQKYFTPEV